MVVLSDLKVRTNLTCDYKVITNTDNKSFCLSLTLQAIYVDILFLILVRLLYSSPSCSNGINRKLLHQMDLYAVQLTIKMPFYKPYVWLKIETNYFAGVVK